MITICTSSDCATIAMLWNRMAGIAGSCWYQAATSTPTAIEKQMNAGMIFALATNGEEPVGFGLWRQVGDTLRQHALAGETAEVYYRLMVACADWGIARGLTVGWNEIDARQTRESEWMNALAAVAVEPIGYAPLVEGQDPQLRVVKWLRMTANLAALRAAALDELGG